MSSYILEQAQQEAAVSWKCPEDWKYIPEMEPATEGMLMALLFGDHKRWCQIRSPWFRRCNASGKWIWPFQKAWFGVVAINHRYISGMEERKGSYIVAWLTEDQYVIQKLKGNI